MWCFYGSQQPLVPTKRKLRFIFGTLRATLKQKLSSSNANSACRVARLYFQRPVTPVGEDQLEPGDVFWGDGSYFVGCAHDVRLVACDA